MFFLYLGFFHHKSIFGADIQLKQKEVNTLLQDTRSRFEFLPNKKESCYNNPICYTDYPYLNKLEITIHEVIDNQKYPISFLFDYNQIGHHPSLPLLRQNFKNNMDNLLRNKNNNNMKEDALTILQDLINNYTSIIINNLVKNDGEFQYDNRGPKILLSINPEEKSKFKKVFLEDPFKIILPLNFKSLIGKNLENQEYTALNLLNATLPFTHIYKIAADIGHNINIENLKALDFLIMTPLNKYSSFINKNIQNLMFEKGKNLPPGFLKNTMEELADPQQTYKMTVDFNLDQQSMNESFLQKPMESMVIMMFLNLCTKIFPLVEFHVINPAIPSGHMEEEKNKIKNFHFILYTLQGLEREQLKNHTSITHLIKYLTQNTMHLESEKTKSSIRIMGGFTEDNLLLYTLFKIEIIETLEKSLIKKEKKILQFKELPLVDIALTLQDCDVEIYVEAQKEGFFIVAPTTPEKFLAKIVQEQKKNQQENKNIMNKWINNFSNWVDAVSKEKEQTHLQAFTLTDTPEVPKNFFSKLSSKSNSNKIQQKDPGAFSAIHHIYMAPHVKGLHKKREQTIHRDVMEFLSAYAQIEELIMDDVSRQEDILCFLSVLGPSLKNLKMYINTSKDFKRLYKEYRDNEKDCLIQSLEEMEIVLDPTISDNNDENLYNIIKVFADLGLKSSLLNKKSVNLYITLPIITRDKFDKELKAWGATYPNPIINNVSKNSSSPVVFYMDFYEFNVYEDMAPLKMLNPNRTEISTNYGAVQITYHQNPRK